MSFNRFSGWFILAGVLLAFILLVQPRLRKHSQNSVRLLPGFQATSVTSIQVRPQGKPEIRAEHTNSGWVLTEPLNYPARTIAIDALLAVLQSLTPVAHITHEDLMTITNAEHDFGFVNPQATLVIWMGDYRLHLFVGSRTPPGDQVYFQVAGDEGTYVVDASLLRFLPSDVADWRSRDIFHLESASVERVAVTNGPKVFELQRNGTNNLWRIVTPGSQVRADNDRIGALVSSLQQITIARFVSDATNLDLDTFGLATPSLQLQALQGSNSLGQLAVGKTLTNEESFYYARIPGQGTVFAIEKATVEPWRKANELRNTHLLTFPEPVGSIEVNGADNFKLTRVNGTWSLKRLGTNATASSNSAFPIDQPLVADLLSKLADMEIVQFVKDVVTDPDLAGYGLATPAVQYQLEFAPTNVPPLATNVVIAVGTNQEDKVFVRRKDESAVYAVPAAAAGELPAASWQFRDRRIWRFDDESITGAVITQAGGRRELVRNGKYEWLLAPGSPGLIKPLAVEETVRPLCQLSAATWVGHGETNRALFGLTNNYTVTLKTKQNNDFTIEFGSPAPTSFPYAAVTLNGELWIFELPLQLARDVLEYLVAGSK